MRIALAQTEIFSKQYEKNKETAVSICNLAQAMEVRLLLFPEMSFTGFNMDTDYSIAAGLDTVPWMQTLAATGECYLGFGWVKAAESGKAENHYSIVAPDGSLFFDMVKLHPFSYAQEDQFFEKGNALPTCEIDGTRFGCLIAVSGSFFCSRSKNRLYSCSGKLAGTPKAALVQPADCPSN